MPTGQTLESNNCLKQRRKSEDEAPKKHIAVCCLSCFRARFGALSGGRERRELQGAPYSSQRRQNWHLSGRGATFKVVGDNLEVHIKMKGVPASIEHWEHFHGFPDGKNATCATPEQDKNKDGYVDLGETEPVMGTTMVPFNDKPEEMNIPTHTSARRCLGKLRIHENCATEGTSGKIWRDLQGRVNRSR
jgi:hypothetical protein